MVNGRGGTWREGSVIEMCLQWTVTQVGYSRLSSWLAEMQKYAVVKG